MGRALLFPAETVREILLFSGPLFLRLSRLFLFDEQGRVL